MMESYKQDGRYGNLKVVYLATLRAEIISNKQSYLEKRQRGKGRRTLTVGVNTLPQSKVEIIGFQ